MINRNYNFFFSLVFLISLFFGILTNNGFYGYNIDYYEEYSQSNLNHYALFDNLGLRIATLDIFNNHIGVGLVSFILGISSGSILISFFKIIKSYALSIFLIIFLIILHTHPIIMSTSGSMRQGLMMSMLFLSFSFLIFGKLKLSFFFIFISIFMHKVGIFFFFIYILTFLSLIVQKNFQDSVKTSFLIFIGILLMLFFYYLLHFHKISIFHHRVIFGDFRLLWLIINLFYFFYFAIIYKYQNVYFIRFIFLFLFFCSLVAISLLMNGLNDHYERFNMILSILYILSFAFFLKKNLNLIFYFIVFLTYLFITIYQGMYSIGLN
jgi:hypothetical protein